MGRALIILVFIGLVALGFGLSREPAPPPLLDVPEMVSSGFVSGRSPGQQRGGRLYWSTAVDQHLSSLEVASFGSSGKPEIVTGEFVRPIAGRKQALYALGADGSYKVTTETHEFISHVGGPFEEFTLYRSQLYVDEYSGFFAATHIGLVNLQ
jgi:hypothetical protein